VDYFEVQVNKLNSEAVPSTPASDAQYQYQRAYALSRNLTENLYVYSNEQIKQIQAQNVLVYVFLNTDFIYKLIDLACRQRATQTAHSITELASSSLTSAQARIHSLSDTMLQELQKLQSSTASLPQSLQSTFPDLRATISEFRNIATSKDIPLNEKATRIGLEVRDRVNPLLEEAKQRVRELIGIAANKKDKTAEQYVNGNGLRG
jgi:hypothetical protein